MTDKRQPEALRLALSIDVMDTFTDYQQEELNKAAAELRRLHAETERLSGLCDKWNSECDEFREDNKRLAALVEAQQHTRIAELEAELEAVGAGGVQALSAAPAVAAPAAPTPEHIAAMERAWLWMDNQADQQSKGGHATFDLMMLREERDALREAIDGSQDTSCEHCHGSGEVLLHTDDCDDELCALNGDQHSCVGKVEDCQCVAPTPPALSAAPARPTVEQVEDEVSMGHGAWDMVDPQELIGAVLRLAASPTPPAEQQAAPKVAPVVWLSSKQLRGVTALHGQYLPFRCQPEGRFDTPVYLVEATPKAAPVKACVCGEPQASGTVHRVDGPCYVVAHQQEAHEPVALHQVYRCKIKSRKQIDKEIPRELQGWWADVAAGQKLLLRQAVQSDLDRCHLGGKRSKDPNDYMCETQTNGSLVSKIALEYMHPEQNVFAAVPPPPTSAEGAEHG